MPVQGKLLAGGSVGRGLPTEPGPNGGEMNETGLDTRTRRQRPLDSAVSLLSDFNYFRLSISR